MMEKSQRIGLALGVAALAAAAATAFAVPARAHVQTAGAAKPGAWCGGTRWKVMTLSDTSRKTVKWSAVGASISDLSKMTPPTRFLATRSSSFEKQLWQLTAVIERYRVASNGEIVFEMYDPQTDMYMNAYLSNPQCLSSTTRDRAGIVATRNAFLGACPAPTADWQTLGTTVTLTGVGYWNPVRSTLGALANGAELRPVTGLSILQGCGHF
jgi:hypothetical protein